VIQTHTRFFLATFLWGWYARRWKKKRIHVEHGSDYIQVSSWFTNKIAYLYDRIIWKRVFKKANVIVPISNACKRFIEKEFWRKKDVQVIYRWLDIPNNLPEVENLHKKFRDKLIVWFIWRLYKRKNVESLVKAYYEINKELQDKIQIVVVWDWEDTEYLKSLDKENKVYFTWWKPFLEALAYQKQFDIHMHTSNPWGWLATTLLQAMYFWCLIVATPN
jgi:glycosyltransferase involved in cell wall biosynthesis